MNCGTSLAVLNVGEARKIFTAGKKLAEIAADHVGFNALKKLRMIGDIRAFTEALNVLDGTELSRLRADANLVQTIGGAAALDLCQRVNRLLDDVSTITDNDTVAAHSGLLTAVRRAEGPAPVAQTPPQPAQPQQPSSGESPPPPSNGNGGQAAGSSKTWLWVGGAVVAVIAVGAGVAIWKKQQSGAPKLEPASSHSGPHSRYARMSA